MTAAPTETPAAREHVYCAMCGATRKQAQPQRIGMCADACPKCGTFRSCWRFSRATDKTFARVEIRKLQDAAVEVVSRKRELKHKRMDAVNRALGISVASRMPPISDAPPARSATFRARNEDPPDTEDVPISALRTGSGLAASRSRDEAEWTADYERRTRGRVEAPAPDGEGYTGSLSADISAKHAAARREALATDPRGELVAAARAGDAYAVRRCEALFGDSWKAKRCVA